MSLREFHACFQILFLSSILTISTIRDILYPSIFILNPFPTSNTAHFVVKHSHGNSIFEKCSFQLIFSLKISTLSKPVFRSIFDEGFQIHFVSLILTLRTIRDILYPSIFIFNPFQTSNITHFEVKHTHRNPIFEKSIFFTFSAYKPYKLKKSCL